MILKKRNYFIKKKKKKKPWRFRSHMFTEGKRFPNINQKKEKKRTTSHMKRLKPKWIGFNRT
jgi:hypothetical protein